MSVFILYEPTLGCDLTTHTVRTQRHVGVWNNPNMQRNKYRKPVIVEEEDKEEEDGEEVDDNSNNSMLQPKKRAALVICAVLCEEFTKKKRRRRSVWVRNWLTRRGVYGLSVLQRELEIGDMKGFRDLLRMSVEEFNYLLAKVTPLICKRDTHLRKAISPKMRLSVTLRFLATGETFNSLSFQYRIGSTTLSRIVMETCTALNSVLREDYLKTPTTEAEWKAIANDFASKWQFPHCLGAVDGKHIVFQPPAKSGSMFYNYKSRFSIMLMAVVDAKYRFVYASAGTQGRVSEAGVFAHSDLKEAMDTGRLNFPPEDALPGTDVIMPYMVTGDDAYPLRPDLLKPYPCRHLDTSQRIYNYRLSRARRVVENAFGILANRFRVFRSTICLDPDKVVTIIFACLCLHNFLRHQRSDAYVPSGYVDSEDANYQLVEGAWRKEGALQSIAMRRARNPTVEAKRQRDILCQFFVSSVGKVSWRPLILCQPVGNSTDNKQRENDYTEGTRLSETRDAPIQPDTNTRAERIS